MQGASAADPVDFMLYVSLAVFGLAVLWGIPMWYRNWHVRRGAYIPITQADISNLIINRWMALIGAMGILSSLVAMASRALPFAGFMALRIAGGCGFIGIAFAIDAARARRH